MNIKSLNSDQSIEFEVSNFWFLSTSFFIFFILYYGITELESSLSCFSFLFKSSCFWVYSIILNSLICKISFLGIGKLYSKSIIYKGMYVLKDTVKRLQYIPVLAYGVPLFIFGFLNELNI